MSEIEKLTTEEEDMSEINQLDETPAADTLHPGAGSSGTESRAQMMDTFVALLAQLGKEDLSDLFNRTLETIGHEGDAIPADAAAKNMASIATKATVKEAVDDMFGREDLTEEFKEKASTIFEAALNSRITIETARLEEEFDLLAEELADNFETQLEEETASMFEEVSEKLNQYLDYVVEQWMEENQLAVENSLRADIAEDFMVSLRNLFTEHYINVPTERLDVFGEMKTEIEELKAKLNESIDEKLALQATIEESVKNALLGEVSEGMAVTDSEKLRTLSEGIEYSDAETYRKKLEIVKEHHFSKRTAPSTGLITETVDGTDTSSETVVPAVMSKYVTAISKSVK